eukprot:7384921-Prymnesium_polylepis.1
MSRRPRWSTQGTLSRRTAAGHAADRPQSGTYHDTAWPNQASSRCDSRARGQDSSSETPYASQTASYAIT